MIEEKFRIQKAESMYGSAIFLVIPYVGLGSNILKK